MTVRHVVAWKLGTEDPIERSEQARRIARELVALRETVPGILEISAGPDLGVAGNWDVTLVADFADLGALDEYQRHPAHLVVVDYVRQVVSARVAVDFEL